MEICCKKFISFENLMLKCIFEIYSNILWQYNKYKKYKIVINKGLVYVKSCVERLATTEKAAKVVFSRHFLRSERFIRNRLQSGQILP